LDRIPERLGESERLRESPTSAAAQSSVTRTSVLRKKVDWDDKTKRFVRGKWTLLPRVLTAEPLVADLDGPPMLAGMPAIGRPLRARMILLHDLELLWAPSWLTAITHETALDAQSRSTRHPTLAAKVEVDRIPELGESPARPL